MDPVQFICATATATLGASHRRAAEVLFALLLFRFGRGPPPPCSYIENCDLVIEPTVMADGSGCWVSDVAVCRSRLAVDLFCGLRPGNAAGGVVGGSISFKPEGDR